nr:hypothetical protein [Anaeromyxobacter sp. K]
MVVSATSSDVHAGDAAVGALPSTVQRTVAPGVALATVTCCAEA